MNSLLDYTPKTDSVSLAKIEGKPFTMTKVEDSDYVKNEQVSKGVKITTKEDFDIDGKKWNKFHTVRVVIVKTLENMKLREDILNGEFSKKVKCVLSEKETREGKKYYQLVDA